MGSKFKYALLGGAVIILGLAGYNKLFPSEGDPDITGIQAEFVGEIAPGGRYSRKMFVVKGLTTAGRTVEITDYDVYDPTVVVEESDDPSVEPERPPLRAAEHGDTCEVVVEAQGFEDTVTVNITREASSQKNIGFPNEEDATVTYYTNGDLVFTGRGKVMNFAGSVPWGDCDYSHVYIDESLEFETMDSWFANKQELVYCDPIPKTVKTMKSTFKGCTSLEKTPEYFQCSELQIMDETFSGCTSLKEADVLPVSVSSAQRTFEKCTSLQYPASLEKTSLLTNTSGMFSGCSSLITATAVPETVTVMDKMYEGCINIKEAVKFPTNVQSIEAAYAECQGLITGASIPETVTDMNRCYAGCSSLCGTLEINSDTDSYNGLLQGATTNGDSLQIFGNSGNLLAIQKDSGNSNISLVDPAAAALQNERMTLERQFNAQRQ